MIQFLKQEYDLGFLIPCVILQSAKYLLIRIVHLNLCLLISVSTVLDLNCSCMPYKYPDLDILLVLFETAAFKFWLKDTILTMETLNRKSWNQNYGVQLVWLTTKLWVVIFFFFITCYMVLATCQLLKKMASLCCCSWRWREKQVHSRLSFSSTTVAASGKLMHLLLFSCRR